MSPILPRATGRIAGSSLTMNNNRLARPCGIAGKTSAVSSVYSQWKALLGNVIMSMFVKLTCPPTSCFSPVSADPTAPISNCSGSHTAKVGRESNHITKPTGRGPRRGLVFLASYTIRTRRQDTRARQARPFLRASVVSIKLPNRNLREHMQLVKVVRAPSK